MVGGNRDTWCEAQANCACRGVNRGVSGLDSMKIM